MEFHLAHGVSPPLCPQAPVATHTIEIAQTQFTSHTGGPTSTPSQNHLAHGGSIIQSSKQRHLTVRANRYMRATVPVVVSRDPSLRLKTKRIKAIEHSKRWNNILNVLIGCLPLWGWTLFLIRSVVTPGFVSDFRSERGVGSSLSPSVVIDREESVSSISTFKSVQTDYSNSC
jgi:hypothetical protein